MRGRERERYLLEFPRFVSDSFISATLDLAVTPAHTDQSTPNDHCSTFLHVKLVVFFPVTNHSTQSSSQASDHGSPLSLSSVLSPLLTLKFKRFHREIVTELERKTEMDVKYMTVSCLLYISSYECVWKCVVGEQRTRMCMCVYFIHPLM